MEKGIYGEDMVFWEFTKSTAKLIETVQGSKELRKMIRTLNFHTLPYYPGDPVSGVRTSLGHAIEPFLMQGCNPQSLGFDDHERDWPNLCIGQLNKTQQSKLRELTIQEFTEETLEVISWLKGLRHLFISSESPDFEPIGVAGPPKLEHFTLGNYARLDLETFLKKSRKTIRQLDLPAESIPHVDLSFYPKLTTLSIALQSTVMEEEEEDMFEAKKFWSSYSKSKLQVLAFDGHKLSPELEETLFSENSGFFKSPPTTLRRIEFHQTVSFDRLRWILKNLGPVKEIGFDERFLEDDEIAVVKLMCWMAKVELIWIRPL